MAVSGMLASQNLINNPGFEEYNGKRISYSNDVSKAISWTGLNTADYFNTDERARINYEYKKQLVFLFKPHTGTSYAGIRIQKQYKEFIQSELIKPLQQGKIYEISWYICLSEHCLYQLKNLGFCLSNEDIALKEINRKTPFVIMPVDLEKIGNQEWQLMRTTFTARGNEKFITIGNFNSNQRKELIFRSEVKILSHYLFKKFKKVREAYYYLDDISIIPIDAVVPAIKKDSMQEAEAGKNLYFYEFLKEDEIRQGQSFVLHHIYFEFNESRLMSASFEELDKLYELLQDHPSMKIMIIGHTDNIGSDNYNQELSDRRARAVAEYLTDKGIISERITWKGIGSKEPVADNTTEAGRKQNRRVEFVIVKE